MYALYGVGMPVTGPCEFFTGLSRIVVLVAGALRSGYASRNGRLDAAWLVVVKFKGAGALERPEGGIAGDVL